MYVFIPAALVRFYLVISFFFGWHLQIWTLTSNFSQLGKLTQTSKTTVQPPREPILGLPVQYHFKTNSKPVQNQFQKPNSFTKCLFYCGWSLLNEVLLAFFDIDSKSWVSQTQKSILLNSVCIGSFMTPFLMKSIRILDTKLIFLGQRGLLAALPYCSRRQPEAWFVVSAKLQPFCDAAW